MFSEKKMVIVSQKCISNDEEMEKFVHSKIRLKVCMGKFYFHFEGKDFS